MRYWIVTGFICFGLHGVLAAQAPSTSLVFDERVFTFDTIQESKGKVSHTFTFQNKGRNPVTIFDVYSACGCIGKAVTNGPIKPGAKGTVSITFDPAYRPGFFSKEVIVYSEGGKAFNRIWVEGVVKPSTHAIEEEYPYNFGSGLYLRLKVMAFGYVKPGVVNQLALHYTNNTDKPMKLSFVPEGNRDGLQFTNPGTIPPQGKGVMIMNYAMPVLMTKTEVAIKVYPYVNGKKMSAPLLVKALKSK